MIDREQRRCMLYRKWMRQSPHNVSEISHNLRSRKATAMGECCYRRSHMENALCWKSILWENAKASKSEKLPAMDVWITILSFEECTIGDTAVNVYFDIRPVVTRSVM